MTGELAPPGEKLKVSLGAHAVTQATPPYSLPLRCSRKGVAEFLPLTGFSFLRHGLQYNLACRPSQSWRLCRASYWGADDRDALPLDRIEIGTDPNLEIGEARDKDLASDHDGMDSIATLGVPGWCPYKGAPVAGFRPLIASIVLVAREWTPVPNPGRGED